MQCEEIKKFLLNRPVEIKIGSAALVTWLLSYLRFRPIAVIVSSVYVTWIYRTFYSHYRLHISKEFVQECKKQLEGCKNLRQSRPHVFCGFISSILFLLAYAGHILNATQILMACLIAGILITSKYDIKLVKEENNDSSPRSGIDVDEFCPRMDEENLKILKQIGDHADDTEIYLSHSSSFKSDSDSDNELLPKKAFIEADDLLKEAATVLTQSAEYRRKHFSSSSDSSDSDDSITRGLDFKNIPVTATIEPHHSTPSSNLLTNIQQTFAMNLIDNIMKAPTAAATKSSQSQAYDSDDEISDFEILDKDDFMK